MSRQDGRMDYDMIAGIFLTPTGAEPTAVMPPSSPARRLRDAIEPIATIGWWSRSAAEAALALGHDFFDGYVWGRAAALGADVATPVVISAFGVFNGALVGPVYEHGRSISSRAAVLASRSSGAAAGLRHATSGIDENVISTAGATLLAAVSTIEPGPRHLFGALQALAVPDDSYGRLWRAAELVREHRGDTHLAACAVAGLDMAEMNVLTEVWLGYPVGEYSSTRGFDAASLASAVESLTGRGWMADGGTLTTAGRAARDAIESATDLGQARLIEAIGSGLDDLVATLGRISDAVLEARAAPADPRKRAAG